MPVVSVFVVIFVVLVFIMSFSVIIAVVMILGSDGGAPQKKHTRCNQNRGMNPFHAFSPLDGW